MTTRRQSPAPDFDSLARGDTVRDRAGIVYRVVRARRVPLSDLPGAATQRVVVFERRADGVRKPVKRAVYEAAGLVSENT